VIKDKFARRHSGTGADPIPSPRPGAKPIGTQHRSIFFEPNSANMSLGFAAIVDEVASFMRAYENTIIDIEGNTDATGSREYNMKLSAERAGAVKELPHPEGAFPAERMRTVGRGPDNPLDSNAHSRRPREEPAHRYQVVRESGPSSSAPSLGSAGLAWTGNAPGSPNRSIDAGGRMITLGRIAGETEKTVMPFHRTYDARAVANYFLELAGPGGQAP